MRRLREAWRCDCDGVSHEFRAGPPSAEHHSTRSMAGELEKLTGYRPPSCPWRAFFDPLVDLTIKTAINAEKLGSGAIEPDSPAILVDALGVYWSALNAVRNHDAEIERKKREQERNTPKRR